MKNPNGYGSVYRMKGNRRKPFIAAVSIVVDGKRKRKALGYYASRRDALAALSEYNQQPYDVAAREITVGEFFEQWLAYRATRPKGHRATIAYKSTFTKHCAPAFPMRLVDVQSIHIQQYIDTAKSPVVADRIRAVWRLLFRYASLIGLTRHNPALVVDSPTIPKSTMHKPFTPAEVRALWQHEDTEIARFALIYIYTGMRPSELLQIRVADVHLDERYMIGGMKTTAGINREIPIAERIVHLIKGFVGSDPVYLVRPRYYSLLRNRWLQSKIPELHNHTPHDCRHTTETALDNAGVNKRTIQLIMGHAGRDIDEDIYTHKTTAQLIEAINKIDAVFMDD